MSAMSVGGLFGAARTSGVGHQSEGNPRAWALAKTGLDRVF